MAATKEDLQERAQLVRIHEANCAIDHPTPDEANFRVAVMKQIGTMYGLAAMRKVEITGPTPRAAGQRPATK